MRDFVAAHGDREDKATVKALEHTETQIAKFNPDSYKASRIRLGQQNGASDPHCPRQR